MIATTTDNQK